MHRGKQHGYANKTRKPLSTYKGSSVEDLLIYGMGAVDYELLVGLLALLGTLGENLGRRHFVRWKKTEPMHVTAIGALGRKPVCVNRSEVSDHRRCRVASSYITIGYLYITCQGGVEWRPVTYTVYQY